MSIEIQDHRREGEEREEIAVETTVDGSRFGKELNSQCVKGLSGLYGVRVGLGRVRVLE